MKGLIEKNSSRLAAKFPLNCHSEALDKKIIRPDSYGDVILTFQASFFRSIEFIFR